MQERKWNFDISIILGLAEGRDEKRVQMSVDSLNTQDFPVDRAQLIFVNHGHANKKYVIQCKYLTDSIYIPNENHAYNACRGRNAAIPYIRGKLVFFMHDGATLIGADYLRRLWRISKYGKNGVATRKLVINGINPVDAVSGWYAHQDAIPARYFKKLKFDEIFDGGHGYDDLDLYNRALKEGCMFASADDLVSAKIRPADPISKKYSEGQYVERNIHIYNERYHK